MLKKSIYNIEIDTLDDGNKLMFNTATCALGVLDKDGQNLYESIEKVDLNTVTDEKSRESITNMVNNGFLVESDIDEIEKLKVLNKVSRFANKKALSLIIAPTMNCNMKCPYCYEDKTNSRMSETVKSGIVNFVRNRILESHKSSVKVVWYGGEPLMEKETIRELSKQLISLCEENNVLYEANIITNGVLLDNETARMLKDECRINYVQITIDGFKETHNKRRILKNGDDSFNIIMKNINESKHLLKISIRINVDKTNLEETKDLIKYLSSKEIWSNEISLYYHPVRKSPNETYSFDKNCCFDEHEFTDKDIDLYKTIINTGNKQILKNLLIPSPKYVFCGAECTDNFVIDPKGYIYTCFELCGNEKHNIGNVANSKVLLNGSYIKWLSSDLPEKCTSCTTLPICHGGCPINRVMYNQEPVCNHSALGIKERLKLLYQVCLEDKEFINLK